MTPECTWLSRTSGKPLRDGVGAFGFLIKSLAMKRWRLRSTFCAVSSSVKPRLSWWVPYSSLTPPERVLKPWTSQGMAVSASEAMTCTPGVRLGRRVERSRSRRARWVLRVLRLARAADLGRAADVEMAGVAALARAGFAAGFVRAGFAGDLAAGFALELRVGFAVGFARTDFAGDLAAGFALELRVGFARTDFAGAFAAAFAAGLEAVFCLVLAVFFILTAIDCSRRVWKEAFGRAGGRRGGDCRRKLMPRPAICSKLAGLNSTEMSAGRCHWVPAQNTFLGYVSRIQYRRTLGRDAGSLCFPEHCGGHCHASR